MPDFSTVSLMEITFADPQEAQFAGVAETAICGCDPPTPGEASELVSFIII
jgi:hypothetical protein